MTKNDFIYALKTSGCLYHNGQTFYEENELIRTFEDMEMFEEDKALSQEPCDDVEHIDYQDDFETASKKIHDYEERQKQNDKRCGDCKLIGTDTCYMVCGGSKSLYKPKQKSEPCDDAISRDFQIGDEVRIIGSDPIYDDCDVGWVIRNASEKVKTMYVMRNDGSADEEAKAEWYRTGRHNDTLAEVIRALPSVTQKSGKWISVRERLPEENKQVLIQYRTRYRDDVNLFDVTSRADYNYWQGIGREIDVIAWMPLPEPYKAESEE